MSGTTLDDTGRAAILAALVALSAIVASAAVAGPAVAEEHDLTVEVDDADVAVGETVAVDVTLAEAAAAETAGGNFVLEYDDAVLEYEGAHVDERWDAADLINDREPGELDVLVLSLENVNVPVTQITLTFTAVAEGETGLDVVETDYVTADGTQQTAHVDDGTVTVDGSWWAPYVGDDGVVETDGLRTAIDDWRTGDLTTDRLRTVIDHWRTGDPIEASQVLATPPV